MHTTYYIILEFLWSTQVLIARSSMLALPCPVLPALATHYACNILASRLWRRNVYAVCAVCVCALGVSVSMLYAIVTVTATMRIRHALTFYYAESRSSNAFAPISLHPTQV